MCMISQSLIMTANAINFLKQLRVKFFSTFLGGQEK